MRWAIIGLIGLGVLAAACAAPLVASVGGTKNDKKAQVDIIVAAKAMAPMTVIHADDVSSKTISKGEAHDSHFTNSVQVVGRPLIIPVAEGQALTEDCFGDRDSAAKLAATIPHDKVAANITLSDSSSIENLLYPGCLVDVIWTSRPQDEKEQPTSRTIFQTIYVLAIDEYSIVSPKHEGDHYTPLRRGEGRKVTLLLTPTQAKSMQVAQTSGSISLALRNPGNRPGSDAESISLNNLLGKKDQRPGPYIPSPTSAPAPIELPPIWQMDLIRGGTRETRELPMPESGGN